MRDLRFDSDGAAAVHAVLRSRRPARRVNGSTSHDGWYLDVRAAPGLRACGDLEAIDNPAARYMAERCGLGILDFLRFWTALESIAKLTDRPAHLLFHRFRESPDTAALLIAHPRIRLHTRTFYGLVASVAWTQRLTGGPADRGGVLT